MESPNDGKRNKKSADVPQPKVLTFINVNHKAGKNDAESRKTVRTLVALNWHRKKRIANTIDHAQAQQQNLRIAKGESSSVVDAAGHLGSAAAQSAQVVPAWPPPSVALPYLDNLIPYSYFTGGGPVLYLRPSKWPFKRPFTIAGADPKETFGKSVFPRQSIWMPGADIPDKALIKGPLLGGDVLSWISHTSYCFQYRVELISWIQQQLASPESATNDATIGAIMTLTMWENGEGSSLDLARHMDGLEHVVRLKGGVASIAERKMVAKLLMFDCIIAISCAKNPRFRHLPLPQPDAHPSGSSQDIRTAAKSPVYGSGGFSHIQSAWRRDDIVFILQTMWDLTSQALDSQAMTSAAGKLPQPRPKMLIARVEGDDSSDQNLVRRSDPKFAEEMHVFETLHFTALIYQRAVSSPAIPFNCPLNHANLSSLYVSLNISAADQFWARYPGIRLWVLLVGCATSVNREERSYFMMFLAKMGIFADFRQWDETQSAILRFLDVQKLART